MLCVMSKEDAGQEMKERNMTVLQSGDA